MRCKFSRGCVLFGAAVLGTVALGVRPVQAGFVAVKASAHSGEADHASILGHQYGGAFHDMADGKSMTNGSVTVTRLDDKKASTWTGGSFTAAVIGRFAGWKQSLGYLDGTAGGAYHDLVDAKTVGFAPAGESVDMDMHNSTWRWARGGEGETFSSQASDNGGSGQLVTYQVSGLGVKNAYLLFWEDVSAPSSDRDYNDLVVEIRSAGPNGVHPTGVPLPPAVWTGLSALLGGGFLSRVKSVRRWIA